MSFSGRVLKVTEKSLFSSLLSTQQSSLPVLFPDTCYRFNSGGDPAAIPDLTYEAYKKTYETFYTPQNARGQVQKIVGVAAGYRINGFIRVGHGVQKGVHRRRQALF